jgi:hypothetical protein
MVAWAVFHSVTYVCRNACRSSCKVPVITVKLKNWNMLRNFSKPLQYKILLKSIMWYSSCYMLNGRHDEASRYLSAPYILPRGILMAGKHTIKESQNLNSVVPFTKLKSWQIYIHFLNCYVSFRYFSLLNCL